MSMLASAFVAATLVCSVWAATVTVPAAGLVISAGSQLTLNAGDVVALNGMLIIEAGAKLVAAGTASQPITFTGVNSASGILILGGSGTSADTQTFTDIASGGTAAIPTYTDTYGGSVQTQNVMTYCYLDSIGDNAADVNALTLVGLDSTHTFNYLYVTNAQDDGIEIFAGTVNLNNIQITDAVRRCRCLCLCLVLYSIIAYSSLLLLSPTTNFSIRIASRFQVDDFIDVDDGWTGTITNITLQTTSSTNNGNAFKSMMEVGGGSGTTTAKFNNVNYISPAGANVFGTLTPAYYTSSDNSINIKSGSLTIDSVYTYSGSAASTSFLKLAIPADGPYTWTATTWGVSSLTVAAAGLTVSANTQLIIEPGAIVTLNGMIIVEAGGRLIARGTAAKGILWNGVGSQSGVMLLGGTGSSSADTSTFTDIPSGTSYSPVYVDTYGGSIQPVNVIVYNSFANIGNNANDVNALTLVGLSAVHTINNLKITDAQDDGIEIFAGSVSLSNIQIIDAVRVP
jgi:hypothetical protein